jgi:hypothetical protein
MPQTFRVAQKYVEAMPLRALTRRRAPVSQTMTTR